MMRDSLHLPQKSVARLRPHCPLCGKHLFFYIIKHPISVGTHVRQFDMEVPEALQLQELSSQPLLDYNPAVVNLLI